MSFKVIPVLFYLFSPLIFAQAIYVTADRIKTKESEATAKIIIINQEQIKNTHSDQLVDVLKQNANLDIIKSGPNGSTSSIFIRGTEASHTLVILDGVVLNDPSNPSRQFDLSKLNASNLERVEIITGPQSILYGSNAIGGAIILTSKSGISRDSIAIQIDSHNSLSTKFNQSNQFNDHDINWGLYTNYSDGYSASKDSNRLNDKDGNKSYGLNFSIMSKVKQNSRYGFTTRFQKENMDLDKGGGPGTDDHNYSSHTQEIFSKLFYEKFWSDSLSSKFNYGYVNQFRKSIDGLDNYQSYSDNSSYRGVSHQISVENTIVFSENFTLDVNLGNTQETAERKSLNNAFLAWYSKYSLNQNTFNFGARLDYFETFKEHLTYKLGYSRDFDRFQIRSSFSTGFKAPSINQLYATNVGNKELKPEESRSIDLGLDLTFAIHQLSFTTFYNHISNRLSYDPARNYLNINSGSAMTKGIEFGFRTFINSYFTDSINYNLTEAIDLKTKKRLPRRAENQITHRLSYENDNHKINFENQFKSGRADINNSNQSVQLKKFAIMNIYYDYTFKENLAFNGSIKNIFKSDYQEIWGYNNGGRILALGINYKF